ncbi:MAG TPA: protein-L-isoaspartate(D-aspartate) O-methyltransferase [Kofleriaceae bacterium]|nr:protein-L-isoaspartate(D-aspartate) O-methyltransferase [Kofleriaceae bacterium]
MDLPEQHAREQRQRMVVDQLEARDVRDPRVLAAMAAVPRHAFVPPELLDQAYDDAPLPIGRGQTISQPYVVAAMTELAAIAPDARVLEIGTGCGYQTAVLAELAAEVYSIEIVPELAEQATATLDRLGYDHVHVRVGDGYAGWLDAAPFDAILVTAAPPAIPDALLHQLAIGGRLVIPVGTVEQELELITRVGEDRWTERTIFPVRFVPMTRTPPPWS